jgi:integrase
MGLKNADELGVGSSEVLCFSQQRRISMSVYFVKGKGWRFDFTLEGIRNTEAWFETKREAKQAEAKKRKELKNPKQDTERPIDMAFLDLVNLRLDYVKAYNSESHYRDVLYHARRWIKKWNGISCCDLTPELIEKYTISRAKISPFVANKDLQYLRALFNYGLKRKLINGNPTDGIPFIPIEKRKKYIPQKDDVMKVIAVADPDTQQYLWTILLTAARVNEINSLTWEDISFKDGSITLWTRKRKGGNREPREITMVQTLYNMLLNRFTQNNGGEHWVFWHRYWSRKTGGWAKGPFKDRKKIMKTLCRNAGVKYFRFHALRHLTASMLDDLGVPIGVIQRILGHQNRQTTEIYLHSVGEAEGSAMSKLCSDEMFASDFVSKYDGPTNMGASYWQRKVERPSSEALKKDVERLGYSGAGRKYGVSDNSVRKWLKLL